MDNLNELMDAETLMKKCGIGTRAGLHYRIKKIGKTFPVRRFNKKTYYELEDAYEIIAFEGHRKVNKKKKEE